MLRINMIWEKPLLEGVILKRYKRFFADIELDGKVFTAHVPNTGSMESTWAPGWKCAVSKSLNPNRKLPYSLELTHNGLSWIGVNTLRANQLAKEWINNHFISELQGYPSLQAEARVGESRLDFFLHHHETLPSTYVEVKSVTLKREGIAQFPDAITTRGHKHLEELMSLREKGHRAVLLFIIQREDIEEMSIAHSVDKKYALLLEEALKKGVECLAFRATLTPLGLEFGKKIPLRIEVSC